MMSDEARGRYSRPARGRRLEPYHCTGQNPRTGRPCGFVVIEAWSAEGAVVKRRCTHCGTWNTIEVRPEPRVRTVSMRPRLASVLD